MAELRDPSLPAGHLIEVREDGSALRNDGVELTPAGQNPWYVLATVYGEFVDGYDDELAAKNRRIWNGWSCAGKSPEERAALAEKVDLPVEELADLTKVERQAIEDAFAAHLDGAIPVPDNDQYIDMSEIHFSNTAVLEKWIFNGTASFGSASFSGDADFGSASFGGTTYFGSASFNGNAYFGSASFSGFASFDSTSFSGDAFFRSTWFSEIADFGSASFSGDADFGSASFSEAAFFRSTSFSGTADFGSASFSEATSFDSVSFSGDAGFDFASFSEAASFGSTSFSGDVFFGSASFSGDAYFGSASFSEAAYFGSASFKGTANFDSASFSGYTDFSNHMFDGRTVFTGAKFLGGVPKFYQRDFHQDTEFTTDPDLWPTITAKNANESKRAYTRLRKVMNELQNPDDEHFFFRQEMECRRHLENWWNRWPIHVFKWFSGYGHSITRPIAWLAGVIAVGWPLIASHLKNGLATPSVAPISEGLGISIANTFPFLGFGRKMHPDFFKEAPAWIDALSGTQSILGIILLFFLGLGLRNRFRIK